VVSLKKSQQQQEVSSGTSAHISCWSDAESGCLAQGKDACEPPDATENKQI
jgi:hypothetical protein